MVINEAYIFNGDFRKQKARQVTLEVLERHPEIDGFFCASDYMALGCMEAIQTMGKRIPEDIGVIGFDNIPITRYVKPKLSTVAQDDYQKGYEAAKLLIQMENGEMIQKTVTLSCEMKIREST